MFLPMAVIITQALLVLSDLQELKLLNIFNGKA